MTVLVGVKCTDGIVIGADSAATSAAGQVNLLKMAADKIDIIDGRVIVAGTGQVGLGQRFSAVVKTAHGAKMFQKTPIELAKYLCAQGVNDFGSTNATKGTYGALVAAPIDDQGQLIEFATTDFQPELKNDKMNFVSMGSGQMLAEPFLSFVSRTFWNSRIPDLKSAIFGVYWALWHTIQCAPGGVGHPIVLATLAKEKKGWEAHLISDDQLGEQAQHMALIEERIGQYRSEMFQTVEPVPIPKP